MLTLPFYQPALLPFIAGANLYSSAHRRRRSKDLHCALGESCPVPALLAPFFFPFLSPSAPCPLTWRHTKKTLSFFLPSSSSVFGLFFFFFCCLPFSHNLSFCSTAVFRYMCTNSSISHPRPLFFLLKPPLLCRRFSFSFFFFAMVAAEGFS